MFILGDTDGDGGATADISVNGEAVASISTSWENPYSDISGFYEAQITFDVAAAPFPVVSPEAFVNVIDGADE